ncbi:hypothetical protein HK098_000189, partial [Nowakowskiella sp. JEL0407]
IDIPPAQWFRNTSYFPDPKLNQIGFSKYVKEIDTTPKSETICFYAKRRLHMLPTGLVPYSFCKLIVELLNMRNASKFEKLTQFPIKARPDGLIRDKAYNFDNVIKLLLTCRSDKLEVLKLIGSVAGKYTHLTKSGDISLQDFAKQTAVVITVNGVKMTGKMDMDTYTDIQLWSYVWARVILEQESFLC